MNIINARRRFTEKQIMDAHRRCRQDNAVSLAAVRYMDNIDRALRLIKSWEKK